VKYLLFFLSLICCSAVFAQEEDLREQFSNVKFLDVDESDYEIQSELRVLKSTHDVSYPNQLIFSREAGFFHKDFDLEIGFSTGSEDSIYFTLNGSIPTLHSIKYTGPVKFEIPPDSILYKSFVIHGGLQRNAPQKTFRLYAREEYGKGTFNYQLLPQKKKKEYHRFLLRTSYGCWNSTIIKDPAAASLVRGLNFEI